VILFYCQVDAVFLDFAKAFDSVSHMRLLGKAAFYGIRNNLQLWLKDFLTERRQRVVVNGTCSSWSPVKSGVPQGTVLGPILFLIFINDLPDAIKSSIKLFADDTVIYRKIETSDDQLILQKDLQLLETWASRWQMKFAPKKCHTLRITLKKNPSEFTYNLYNTMIEGVKFHKHLGVYISCSLNWSKQCEEVKKKANRVLAVLQRNIHSASRKVKEHAYLALVRPITEYACTAWSPHTAKSIAAVESIQRRAARFVHNDYRRSTSVTTLLDELHWNSLQERKTMIDLSLFYKIQFKLVRLHFPDDMSLNTSRTRKHHNMTYKLLPARIDCFKYSFFPRNIVLWNSLPYNIVNTNSLNIFQNRLNKM